MRTHDDPCAGANPLVDSENPEIPRIDGGGWFALLGRIRQGDPLAGHDFELQYGRGIRALLRHHRGTTGLDQLVRETISGAAAAIRRGEIRQPAELVRFVRAVVECERSAGRRRSPKTTVSVAPDPCPDGREQALASWLWKLSERERRMLTRYYLKGDPLSEILTEAGVTLEEFTELRARLRESTAEKTPKKSAVSETLGPRLRASAATG